MKCENFFKNQEGKGLLGCIFFVIVLGGATYIGINLVPVLYAHKSLETDVRTEVSRAGAHYYDDESLKNNLVMLARRNEIKLVRENIKLDRFAGQVHVTIEYKVPVDFLVLQRVMEFRIKASSFVGRL